ncbi:MAG: hypothetical protein JXB23_16115, partial [Candidatus Aminicenantes bacterium]|nr:hypothetical protein [Candidatus Aminicenantes bacterium]
MTSKKSTVIVSIILILAVSLFSSSNPAEEEGETQEIAVVEWLLLGPSDSPLPAFHNDKQAFGIEDLLKFENADESVFRPVEGHVLLGPDGSRLEWKPVRAEDGEIRIPEPSGLPSKAYLGVYLDVKRWTDAVLSVRSPQVFRVFVDGQAVSTKSKVNKAEEGESSPEGRKTSADLKLETGVHCLLIKTVFDPSANADWGVQAVLSLKEKFTGPMPQFRLAPDSRMSVSLLLDGPKVTGASVSPDGSLAAVSISKSLPPTDESESWVELRRIQDGEPVATYRGGTSVSSVDWAPEGKTFAYISRDKDKGTLWVVELDRGTSRPLLEGVKNLGSFVWAPDARTIIYTVTDEGKKDRDYVKRFKNLADRQPWWRDNSHLYWVDVRSGLRERLTAGDSGVSLNDIHPSGKSLLFTRSVIDYGERPFSRTELYSLDLESLEANKIWTGPWFNQAQWNPSGTKLLVLGGPSTFGTAGIDVPQGTIPNDYDTQAFLYDPSSKKVEAVSREFDPAIADAVWSRTQNCIYFVTTDRSFRRLYRYDLDKKAYASIDTGVEVI